MKRPQELEASGQSTFDFSLPPAEQERQPLELEQQLRALVGETLSGIVLTNNRRRILSTQPDPQQPRKVRLRLHESFLSADEDLLALVADFTLGRLRGPRRRLAISAFREHFERHGPPVPQSPPARRKLSLRPKGSHFALEEIRDRLVERYFPSETFLGSGSPPAITWARRPRASRKRTSRRRSLRLGSYDAGRHLVRIHPVLDHRDVPLLVVESVVHHELLHAVIAIESPCREGGSDGPPRLRRRVHTPEFRRRERLFAHYEAAESWLAKNFDRLLRRRSKGE